MCMDKVDLFGAHDPLHDHQAQPGALAQAIAVRAAALGLRIESISTLAPTLEDVFLSITSHAAAKNGEERPT